MVSYSMRQKKANKKQVERPATNYSFYILVNYKESTSYVFKNEADVFTHIRDDAEYSDISDYEVYCIQGTVNRAEVHESNLPQYLLKLQAVIS